MATTANYNLMIPEGNLNFDIEHQNQNMRVIDKGLVLDVGDSTGTGSNYELDLTDINLNKGTSIKFWADRDSNGAVTINTNYKLLKAGGTQVKNLKSGAPYTITFDGGENFFLASGSGGSDAVTFTSDKLLEGFTANDSNGNAIEGTMPNRGTYTNSNFGLNSNITLPNGYYSSVQIKQNLPSKSGITDALSIAVNQGYLYYRIPKAAYFTNSSSGYPEVRYRIDSIKNNLPYDQKQQILEGLKKKGTVRCTTDKDSRIVVDLSAMGNPKNVWGTVNRDGSTWYPKFMATRSDDGKYETFVYDLYKSAYTIYTNSNLTNFVVADGDSNHKWSNGNYTITWECI